MGRRAHTQRAEHQRKAVTWWLWPLWCVLIAWGVFACEPQPPTNEITNEVAQESRADASVEPQPTERSPDRQEPSSDTQPDDLLPRPEPPRPRPEPQPDARPERATPSERQEPTPPEERVPEPKPDTSPDTAPDTKPDAAPDTQPDTPQEPASEPLADDAGAPDASQEPVVDNTPDRAEPPPERPSEIAPEVRPEPGPDAPPACSPATPPTTTPKEWAISTGDGIGFGFARDIKVDGKGFLYVCGEFTGGPATFHNKTLRAAANSSQMFLVKLDATGKFLWVYALPGQGHRACKGVALGTGTVTITGDFDGSISLPGGGTLKAQSTDMFAAQLDTCGKLRWVVRGGGSSADSGSAVALDAKGNAYVYGQYNGPASFGSHNITTKDSGSVYVAKLDPKGAFQWVAKGGASQAPDTPAGLGVTPQGEVYIAGSSFLPVTFGSTTLQSQNPFELFVAKLNANGTFAWAMQTVGKGRIIPYRGTMDTAGNFYITGELDGTKKFGTMTLTSPSHGDIFLAQVNSQGAFQWVLRPKGTSHLHPYGLTLSGTNAFITGDYSGDPTFGSTTLFGGSNSLRSFVTRASSAPAFTWAINTKGSGDVRSHAIAVGPKGALFVAGNFQSSATLGKTTLQKTPFSFYMFVWKIPKP